jgi:predicted amidohydrolase YtcJ
VLEGAGEVMVWDAHDFENFLEPRPEWDEGVEAELTEVTRVIAAHQWPIRMHATYDETITRILDVFERVFHDTAYTGRWAIDHAETIRPANIARIEAMGGGIAVQNRLAFSGEFFAKRYGQQAAAAASPLRELVDAGIPVGAGTDATRPSSYNPWLSLYWMVTGKTVGDTQIAARESRLSREEALRCYTVGSAWFSGEEKLKGRIAPGQYADFAILSDDYLEVPDERIRTIESVLTVTGGPPAWKTLPCWYLLGTEDKAIPPALQRFMAERANATIVEVPASHVSFVSQPEAATQLILAAVNATMPTASRT